jgi:hypothetical protein
MRVRAQLYSTTKTKAQILKIREVMESLARNTVARACKRFRSRIEDPVLNLIKSYGFQL